MHLLYLETRLLQASLQSDSPFDQCEGLSERQFCEVPSSSDSTLHLTSFQLGDVVPLPDWWNLGEERGTSTRASAAWFSTILPKICSPFTP